VEHIVTEERVQAVSTRFELAIGRMIERWVAAGRFEIDANDVRMAREFLEREGCKVEDLPDLKVRVVSRRGRLSDMTREDAVMEALRRLASRE
jgi:hypothetical protein